MRHLLMFSLLLLLVSCGLRKEITRLTEESKSKTQLHEKRIAELTAKITETETRETKTRTELEIKTSEIAALKRERSELQQQLDKKERADFSVENPKGPVKVTDAKGNSYEFEGGDGTRISNTNESTLSTKLQHVTESLSQQTQRAENLAKTVTEQDNTIKQKDSEINEKSEENTRLLATVRNLNESLAKAILKKGIPAYVWIIAGMFLLATVQVILKIYNVKIGSGFLERINRKR